ncbi:hypothetical protein DMN91_005382 [Ooceraea biroi]|uniref:Testis-expressed sequence 9 protein n=1 Tax=Ooceraea biroi TaxID=2015173 RepID=A0A026VVP1_OOCBI|nr:testis-expressed protein 9 [Ooceraea biroi]EZA46899.1 Testis-expressed sequence 9 protein [Ooceraea biroi]RLU23104.1 hypothetical protein DMN91_005382 [Ooceraea biroi]
MSDDLLAKEREFHRLNRELQLKTRNVMKEVDSVINARVSNNSFSNVNRLYSDLMTNDTKMTEDTMSKPNGQSKVSLIKSPDVPVVENISNIEVSLKKDNTLGNKAIINLLKGKIDMLHKELQATQLEFNRKCDYCKELEVENKKLDDAQAKLHNQIGTLKDTIVKLENTNSDTLTNCQALSNENVALKKDTEALKKEIKVLNQQSNNYDVRLNRILESNEKLKNALKCSQIEEKELRSQIRKLQEDKRLSIKSLEKQRSELVQAFKKQLLLIDNLKKQNMYLTASDQICLIEGDFAKLLEWKPPQL